MNKLAAAGWGFRAFVFMIVGLLAACCSNDDPRVITGIEVSPTLTASLAKGLTLQHIATATYSDDTTENVTNTVTWSSSAPTVASVSASGLVKGLTASSTEVTIKATLGGVEGKAKLAITAAVIRQVGVTVKAPAAAATVVKGQTLPLVATAILSDDSTTDVTATASWSSTAVGVATVGNNATAPIDKGIVTGVAAGDSNISATVGAVSGQLKVTVVNVALTAVEVAPASRSLPKGTSQPFTATAIYNDNSTQDVTATATWQSATPAVATVSAGEVDALAVGAAAITASFTSGGVTKSGSAAVTVTPAALKRIELSPAAPQTLAKGGFTLQFAATGIYTDDSTGNITGSVLWQSSNAAVTISNADGQKGLATSGNAAGSANITAKSGSIESLPTAVTVSNETIDSISVEPLTPPTLALGQSKQFKATALFTGTTTPAADITARATWESDNEAVITVSNAAGSRGFAVSQSVGGPVLISAKLGGKTGSTPVTVDAAELVSIEVSPAAAVLPRGFSRNFVATGTYSDGSVREVSDNTITWISQNSNLATISNAADSRGVARGTAAGETTITVRASLPGSRTVEGSTMLTVSDAALASIRVSPDVVTLPLATEQSLTATGVFADGFEMPITTQVTWQSQDANIATVSNATGEQGKVAASAQGGPINISATRALSSGGSVSGAAAVTVSSATITSITVRSAANCTVAGSDDADTFLPLSFSVPFIACATYTDDSIRNVTAQAVWSSGASSVVVIGNEAGNKGVATAIGEGRTVVKATLGSKSDSAPLQVTIATLSSIAVTPTDAVLNGGGSQQFNAVGTFSDARTLPITTQVTWSSSANTVTISNAPGSQGRASASGTVLFPATVRITAKNGSISGETTVSRRP